jgi:prepilin-type N-terminal cleavage/methylation domain-containing protein
VSGGKFVSGFTLIELAVTISIFVVISTLALGGYPRFARQTSLARTAQEIALSLRRAQSFSLAVRGFETGSEVVFRGWGIYLETAPSLISDPAKEYILFVDLPATANQQYDGATERAELFRIQTSARIVDLCGGVKTLPTGGDCGLSRLDILYQRPNPSTSLKGGATGTDYSDLEIVLEAVDGSVRKTVVIWDSGQVSVE